MSKCPNSSCRCSRCDVKGKNRRTPTEQGRCCGSDSGSCCCKENSADCQCENCQCDNCPNRCDKSHCGGKGAGYVVGLISGAILGAVLVYGVVSTDFLKDYKAKIL